MNSWALMSSQLEDEDGVSCGEEDGDEGGDDMEKLEMEAESFIPLELPWRNCRVTCIGDVEVYFFILPNLLSNCHVTCIIERGSGNVCCTQLTLNLLYSSYIIDV